MTTMIQEYTKTEAALAELRQRYEAVVYDVTSGKGMAEAKKARAEIRDYRVSLEKTRVGIKAPALERCRQIDSEAKRITSELEALESPIDRQIKDEETRKQREKDEAERKERERVSAINSAFDKLKAMGTPLADATSDHIKAAIIEAGEAWYDGLTDELVAAWTHERRVAVASLRAALDKRLTYEEEQEELKALRAQREAVEAEQRRLAELERQRAADEAAAVKAKEEIERAKQAEQEAKEAAARAAEQAELDKAEAVRQAEARATLEAEERERKRREEEEAAASAKRAADEKRAAGIAHRRKINNAAKAALVERGLSDEQAQSVVTMIAEGVIPNVTINY